MTESEAIVAKHLPYLKFTLWQPQENDPVELVFGGMGRAFGRGYFTDVDKEAVSLAENVQSARLHYGELRVTLEPGAEPRAAGKKVVDLLLAIRCLDADVRIPEHFDTPDIFES